MKLLVSGSTASVARMTAHRERLGILLTPANRNSVAAVVATGLPWAIDNGAYSGFDREAFDHLAREKAVGQPGLLWVAAPDTVGNAESTLFKFEYWQPRLAAGGLPIAFVGQDGLESLEPPWDRFECLFLGGSTAWKLSSAAWDLAAEAKRRGKLVHIGRVNSLRRMRVAQIFGCDSIDGSSASMFGDKYIHKYLRWLAVDLGRQRIFQNLENNAPAYLS
jgi:hypothetical protein